MRSASAPQDPRVGEVGHRVRRRTAAQGLSGPIVAMKYFPVFFDLTAQRVLVVGGGEVALRKVALLERSGALITLVAPEVLPELQERAAAGKIILAIREFVPNDLDGARLVIVATSRR